MSFEHHVKFTNICKVALAAAGAGNLLFADICDKLLIRKPIGNHVDAVLLVVALNEMVRSVAHFALLAVDKRVVEVDNVTGGNPNLRIHQNCRVKPHIIGILLHEFSPPGALDVVFKLHAERTVIPAVGESAVDFAAGVDYAAVFAEGYDFVHGFFRVI